MRAAVDDQWCCRFFGRISRLRLDESTSETVGICNLVFVVVPLAWLPFARDSLLALLGAYDRYGVWCV